MVKEVRTSITVDGDINKIWSGKWNFNVMKYTYLLSI